MRTVADIMADLLDIVKENQFQEDTILYAYGGEEVVLCCPKCGEEAEHLINCKLKKLILEAEGFIAVEKENPS